MNITPALKDKLLNYFKHKNVVKFNFPSPETNTEIEIDNDTMFLIFEQFVSKGLVKRERLSSGNFWSVSLTADFFDFHNHGGFTAQEELLQSNIKKLLLEIDTLKQELTPKHLETVNKISAIAGSIATALGLFK